MDKLKKVLKEAVLTVSEFERLGRNQKMSAKGFLRDAISNARTDDKRLDELEKILGDREEQLPAANAFIRKAGWFIREGGCTGPSSELRRLRWLGTEDLDQEFAALQTDLFTLFALAVKKIARDHPRSFGTIESWSDHVAHLKELEAKRDRLYKEIEEAYTSADLTFDDPDSSGRSKVSFKFTDGAVSLGTYTGRRLTEWGASHPEGI